MMPGDKHKKVMAIILFLRERCPSKYKDVSFFKNIYHQRSADSKNLLFISFSSLIKRIIQCLSCGPKFSHNNKKAECDLFEGKEL